MKPNLLDILSNSNKEIDNQQLMDYLSGKLSDQQNHDLEASIGDDDEFMNDALEGLQDMKDKARISMVVDQLNKDLHNKLNEKKKRKEKRKLQNQPWIMVAVVVVLLLILLAYIVIHYLNK